MISIHAPSKGSDNPPRDRAMREHTFQSTLPAKGATPDATLNALLASISIHAPSKGSDNLATVHRGWISHFNPRSQQRERPNHCADHGKQDGISIHAPSKGSDFVNDLIRFIENLFQSTLPAKGATSLFVYMRSKPKHFNPRSQQRERRFRDRRWTSCRYFNPRSQQRERPQHIVFLLSSSHK